MSNVHYGPYPVRTKCYICHNEVVTRVKSEPSNTTHIIALIMCMFFLWPWCIVPYLIDTCQTKVHYCPVCNAYLGRSVEW